MTVNYSETIAALATAPAPAGVAVLRVSGPDSQAILKKVFQANRNPIESPRELVFGQLVNSADGRTLDHCLAVFMPGPHSFTGEDVCEFQLHGSPLLCQQVLRCLYASGARPAEPGEFSKRAFLNSKIDLIQAEAIGDIISANSAEALKVAQSQLSGRLSTTLGSVGEPLRDILAEIEAGIDFPEEDIEPEQLSALASKIQQVSYALQKLISSYSYGQVIKEGFKVLIFGRPNAGKSSLLNYFLGYERAIVTDISGTTRDLIEETVLIDGLSFVFCDTAGITETKDLVEQIGIERARERLQWADLVLLVIDSSAAAQEHLQLQELLQTSASKYWLLYNKLDIAKTLPESNPDGTKEFKLALSTGQGLSDLSKALTQEVLNRQLDHSDSAQIVTNERHFHCLQRALTALNSAHTGILQNIPAELVAAEIRSSLGALDEIIGRTEVEDILGRIFSKFCVGK